MKGRRMALTVAVALSLAGADGGGRAQTPMSNRCFTPSFWCWLPSFAPIGLPCYCGTPSGPAAGIVR